MYPVVLEESGSEISVCDHLCVFVCVYICLYVAM